MIANIARSSAFSGFQPTSSSILFVRQRADSSCNMVREQAGNSRRRLRATNSFEDLDCLVPLLVPPLACLD